MALPCGSTILWGINPPFDGLSPCKGQVAYALLTRAPVSSIATIPLDLHVLSLPLAFILSQDQTLRCIENFKYNPEPQALLISSQIVNGFTHSPYQRNLVIFFFLPLLNIFQ
jgi:hypothetical protein